LRVEITVRVGVGESCHAATSVQKVAALARTLAHLCAVRPLVGGERQGGLVGRERAREGCVRVVGGRVRELRVALAHVPQHVGAPVGAVGAAGALEALVAARVRAGRGRPAAALLLRVHHCALIYIDKREMELLAISGHMTVRFVIGMEIWRLRLQLRSCELLVWGDHNRLKLSLFFVRLNRLPIDQRSVIG